MANNKTNTIGKKIQKKKLLSNIFKIYPLIILMRTWPANIFAHNRIDKLIGRTKYEINSIEIKSNNRIVGTPTGTKMQIKSYRCNSIPIKLIPKKNIKLKKNVNENKLVDVKKNGKIPNTLLIRINKKIKKIMGKIP